MQQLLPLPAVADQLAVAVVTLRRWLRHGQLGYVRCGRSIRIEQSEVEAFIRRNRRSVRQRAKEQSSSG